MSSMQGMRERADRGQPRGADSIWQAATREHGVRSRRRRRVRFSAAAVAAALAVTIGTTAIVDFDDSQPVVATSPGTVDDPTDKPSGRTAAVPDAGISVLVPDGWVFTTNDLSPDAGLQERFAVSTFEPSAGGARCAHLPIAALEQMSRTDAFVWMDERGPTGGNNDGYQQHVPGQRTDLDGIDSNSTIPECLRDDALDNLATLRWLPLHSAGRGFYLIVAIGADADTDRRTQVADVVASIELTPYVPILLERYVAGVADEIRCLESAGATVIGPFPSIDGANLIYDYALTAALSGDLSDEQLDQARTELGTAGTECFAGHTADRVRSWISSVPDGGDPALLAARRVVLDCLRLPTEATDAEVVQRLTADPSGDSTGSCTALTWTGLGIESIAPVPADNGDWLVPSPVPDGWSIAYAVEWTADREIQLVPHDPDVAGAISIRIVTQLSTRSDATNLALPDGTTWSHSEDDTGLRHSVQRLLDDGRGVEVDVNGLDLDQLADLLGSLHPAEEADLEPWLIDVSDDAYTTVATATKDGNPVALQVASNGEWFATRVVEDSFDGWAGGCCSAIDDTGALQVLGASGPDPQRVATHGIADFLFEGITTNEATTVRITLDDGTSVTAPTQELTDTIGARFFLASIPFTDANGYPSGTITAFDSNGFEIATVDLLG